MIWSKRTSGHGDQDSEPLRTYDFPAARPCHRRLSNVEIHHPMPAAAAAATDHDTSDGTGLRTYCDIGGAYSPRVSVRWIAHLNAPSPHRNPSPAGPTTSHQLDHRPTTNDARRNATHIKAGRGC